jgi:SagB-type dehydrogenase family enzyme
VLPHEEDGALVFPLDGRDVTIEGDVEFVRAVVDRCDGMHDLAQLADAVGGPAGEVEELVGALAEQDVVVDCTQAWRRFDRESSVRSTFYREVDEAAVAEAYTWSFRPNAASQRSQPLAPAQTQMASVAAHRRSAWPSEVPRRVSFEELSTVLEAMYGAGDPRPVPSGGAMYPVVVHVAVFEPVGPLEQGVWWYDPEASALELVGGRTEELRAGFIAYTSTEGTLERGHPVIYLSADLRRSGVKYGNRAYRLALMEIGAVMQNAYLVGAETGVPVRAVAGFDEVVAARVLELPDAAVPLLTLLLGS